MIDLGRKLMLKKEAEQGVYFYTAFDALIHIPGRREAPKADLRQPAPDARR